MARSRGLGHLPSAMLYIPRYFFHRSLTSMCAESVSATFFSSTSSRTVLPSGERSPVEHLQRGVVHRGAAKVQRIGQHRRHLGLCQRGTEGLQVARAPARGVGIGDVVGQHGGTAVQVGHPTFDEVEESDAGGFHLSLPLSLWRAVSGAPGPWCARSLVPGLWCQVSGAPGLWPLNSPCRPSGSRRRLGSGGSIVRRSERNVNGPVSPRGNASFIRMRLYASPWTGRPTPIRPHRPSAP